LELEQGLVADSRDHDRHGRERRSGHKILEALTEEVLAWGADAEIAEKRKDGH